VDAEMGRDQYIERVWDMGLNELFIPDQLRYIDASGLDLVDPNDSAYLMEALDGVDLVIMDSLKALSPGATENDNDVMAIYTRTITNMSRKLDAGIITIHHWGKDGERYRGASTIMDQCDAMVAFVPNKARDDQEDDGYRKLIASGRHLKMRYAREPQRRWFAKQDSGLLLPAPDGPPAGAEAEGKWDDAILANLPFEGTKSALAAKCGAAINNKAWCLAYDRVAKKAEKAHVKSKLFGDEPSIGAPDAEPDG